MKRPSPVLQLSQIMPRGLPFLVVVDDNLGIHIGDAELLADGALPQIAFGGAALI